MDSSRTFFSLYLVAIILVLCLVLALAGNAAGPQEPPAIDIIPSDGANLTLVDQLAPNRLLMELSPSVHNWFAGTFTNLPLGQPVTFGFSMTGKDSRGSVADVSKWRGLQPEMTYADPTRYESYEWFRKDARGHWISGDLCKPEAERDAGTGTVPDQQAIPGGLAAEFLSADGSYWSPWREVDATEVLTGVNIFRVTQTFHAPTATVAMRIPFTYTYLQEFLARQGPQVFVGTPQCRIQLAGISHHRIRRNGRRRRKDQGSEQQEKQ